MQALLAKCDVPKLSGVIHRHLQQLLLGSRQQQVGHVKGKFVKPGRRIIVWECRLKKKFVRTRHDVRRRACR